MKNIGFVGVAEATTCTGDVVVAFSVGVEIFKGKSFEAVGGGSCAGGAGRGLVDGDHVMGTGGVEGAPGGGGAGVGAGAGGGVGLVLPALLTPLQAVSVATSVTRTAQQQLCKSEFLIASPIAALLWRTSSSVNYFARVALPV